MANRTQFSVGSCNLYNLNEPGNAIYTDSDGWPQADYDKKIEWLQRTLRDMPSDVLGFQELWHKDSLEAVFDHPDLSYYQCLVPEGHAGQKIVCGAAVRKSLLHGEPTWITNFPAEYRMMNGGDDPQSSDIAVQLDTFSRPVLHFKVKPRSNGRLISVYVVHLKSKLPSKIYYEGWYKDNKDYYKKTR